MYMKKCANKGDSPCPHKLLLQSVFMVLVLAFSCYADGAEEMYIITTRDGSEIIVKNYKFTEEHVEFMTKNDLPGFIKRKDFVKISNMVGVPPGETTQRETIESEKKREMMIWLVSAAVLFVLYIVFMVYVIRKKKDKGQEEVDVYYGRAEKEPVTQGHLAFQYRHSLGRKSDWIIEVRNAYEEDGTLFVEGIATATGKRKTFRADRIDGLVTDVSSGRKAPIHKFFSNADGQDE